MLSALLRAGVPLDHSLGLLLRTGAPGWTEASLVEVRRRVREGERVATALADAGVNLPAFVCGMMLVGETSGRLTDAMDVAAREMEVNEHMSAELQQVLLYPVFLLVASIATVATLTLVVLPKFRSLASELGGEIPPLPAALFGLTDAAQRGLPILAVVATGVGMGLAVSHRNGTLVGLLQRSTTRVPVVGPLLRKHRQARFLGSLSALLQAQVPVARAVTAAGVSTGDTEIVGRVAQVRADLLSGSALSAALERRGCISPLALAYVRTGESSGNLPEMLDGAATAERTAVQLRMRRVVGVLEPALIITCGGIVAVIAAALLQTIYAVRPVA